MPPTYHSAFAYDRKTFIDKLGELLTPALFHHYLLVLLKSCHFTRLPAHWSKEKHLLLDAVLYTLFHTTTLKPSGEKRAVAQAIKEVKSQDARIRRGVEVHFTKTFKKELGNRSPQLLPGDDASFWDEVQELVDTTTT